MSTQFSTSFRIGLIFLAVCLSCSAPAALQLVTTPGVSIAAPPDGNGDSWAPLVSPDGRFILFASTANNLVPGGGSNGVSESSSSIVNVYLRDRQARTTRLVSVNLHGEGANGDSLPAALSTNGQFALFESSASDLVTNAAAGLDEVFLRDVENGVTWLVSIGTNGTSPTDVSGSSTMSPDGRYVAFVSAASNLVANDTNGIPDVFVRDMQTSVTTLASVSAVSNGAGCSSEGPEITPDGHYVIFSSSATNLVPGLTLPVSLLAGAVPASEIYVRDLQAGLTTWASTNARIISKLPNGFCFNQAISDNGQFTAFEISSNIPGPTNGWIFYYNLQTGAVETVCTNAAFPPGTIETMRSLNMTPDGQFITYAGNSGGSFFSPWTSVYLWNAQTGTNLLVSANPTNGVTPGANVYSPDIDPTGRYVIFVSTDTNYTGNPNAAAVLLRDTQAGMTTVVSVNTNGDIMPVNATAVPALSANASTVAFESPWSNLDARNYYGDVFALDLTNTVSQLISVHDSALPSVTPNGPSSLWSGSASTNGRYLTFSTWANNVSANGTNGYIEVFVRDLVTGTNILLSVGSNGAAGNNLSTEPSISGDGRYVAFTSAATNLVANDTNQASDVFIRDLQTGTTTLANVSTNGGVGNGNSYLPQISGDGRYVLFCSTAQNLAPGTSAVDNLYLRDVQLGQTYALTQNGYGAAGGYSSWFMTPNGQDVAFVGISGTVTNLYVWSTATTSIIYTNNAGPFANLSLSPDGHWLAFVANGQLFAQDLVAGTNCQVAAGTFGPRAGLKFDSAGRFLTYGANSNIYLYDFESGSNLLVSTAFQSTIPANGVADEPVISADGSFVAYRSFSTDAVSSNTNGAAAILLYNCLSNSTILASANVSGLSPSAPSLVPVFTGDGQMLVFESWAPDLVADDFDPGSDLFAMDLYGQPGTVSTNRPPILSANLSFQGYGIYSIAQVPVISWPFNPATSYSVQYKDNLTDSVWHNLPGAITYIGAEAYLGDSVSSSAHRFYRIVQNP